MCSSIMGMMTMGKVRYATEKFAHPYKPWVDDHNDKEGQHYRGFKACSNCVEWTVYSVPCLWIFVIYAPAVKILPTVGPLVAPFAGYAGGATALGYAYFNKKYVEGYMQSADGRLAPFHARTAAFKVLIYGALAGVGCAAVEASGGGATSR
jgi:hypothetical protein